MAARHDRVRHDRDDDHRQEDEADRKQADRPQVRAQVAQRGEERGAVEQQRQDADEDEVGRQVDLGQTGDEAERQPAEHEQDRIRDPQLRDEDEHRRTGRQQHQQADEVVVAEVDHSLGEALVAQLAQRRLGLLELEAHAAEDLRRLRELDLAVRDDLHLVAPRVEERVAAEDVDPGLPRRREHGVAVVDDEAEVARSRPGPCVRPSASARNWSPMSTNAMPGIRPRSSRSNSRP